MTETAVTQTAPLPGQEAAPLLQARGVGKRYPGVVALDDVSLTLTRGTVHALLGENGAGKSTLIRILSGIATPDSGELFVDGQPVRLGSASAAQDLGIATIHQEQSLAPDLTVLQNIFLGRELRRSGRGRWLLDERAMRKRVSGLCEEFGLSREYLDRPAGELGALKQHVVQILKALAFDTRAVILDEPTSGLADHERLSLFDHMRSLRDRGVALLWVTHRLDELFGLADVVTVLRDGRHVATVDPAEQTPESLIRLMVGRAVSPAAAAAPSSSGPERRAATEEVLRLEGVSRRGVLHDIDLAVRSGEVLGIAGIAGAGRTELARVILGADKIDSGEISVRGQVVKIRNPRDAYRLGIALVPEERKTQAILGDFSLIKNISISDLRRTSRARAWIDRRKERTAARNYVQDLGVKTSGVTEKIRNLSGGNQQKVIIARCLFTQPSLLIFDEPTQGIDVAAKAEVYRLIYEFVDAGGAAVVISSELPELISVSDRIAVMREGRIAGELPGAPRGAQLREEDKFAESIMALAAREVAS